MARLNLAIVGCGAVTERLHLPTVAGMENITVTLLVDRDRPRAEALASHYDVPQVAEDYRQVWDKADAAIVALPHYLHAPVSVALLTHGVHVLVEKPMALSVSECDAMIEAAKHGQAVLAVGLMRRCLWAAQYTKKLLERGTLGRVEHFDIREGRVYNWPVASDFFFRKEKAGGGVLVDTGAHTLDLVLWWLGDVASLEYYDDGYGGVEANCELRLGMQSNARGMVELSRTRRLRNTAIIEGTKGKIEVGMDTNQFSLHLGDHPTVMLSGMVRADDASNAEAQPPTALIRCQLDDWVKAIHNGGTPLASGEQGRQSVALIESCYEKRKQLEFPWVTP